MENSCWSNLLLVMLFSWFEGVKMNNQKQIEIFLSSPSMNNKSFKIFRLPQLGWNSSFVLFENIFLKVLYAIR